VGVYKLKIVAIGGGSERKKSDLLHGICRGSFGKNYKKTIGCDVYTKDIPVNDDDRITLSIWDITEQERFSFFRSSFYRGAAGAVIFFDLTKYSTFNPQIPRWLRELWTYVGRVPVVLFGFNAEKVNERKIQAADVRGLAEQIPCHYVEGGSQEDIEGAITELASVMLETLRANPQSTRFRVRNRKTSESFIELLKDMGISYSETEALIFRDTHFFRIDLNSGNVFIHREENPDSYAHICLQPTSPGYTNLSLNYSELVTFTKIACITWNELPPSLNEQIKEYLVNDKGGPNLTIRHRAN